MATETSRSIGRSWTIALAAAPLLGAAVAAAIAAGASSSPPTHERGRAFSWLAGSSAPAGWPGATISSGSATLFHPPSWKSIPGDRGTVSFSLRDAAGRYLGYLNVTPRQGAERLAGWGGFRTMRNRSEGDRHVRQLAAAENLTIGRARASCVIDDYLSRVGSNGYREIACILAGRRATNVFVGAALLADWQRLGPVIERAASGLLER
jgi:hypothetical protein